MDNLSSQVALFLLGFEIRQNILNHSPKLDRMAVKKDGQVMSNLESGDILKIG